MRKEARSLGRRPTAQREHNTPTPEHRAEPIDNVLLIFSADVQLKEGELPWLGSLPPQRMKEIMAMITSTVQENVKHVSRALQLHTFCQDSAQHISGLLEALRKEHPGSCSPTLASRHSAVGTNVSAIHSHTLALHSPVMLAR
ncbi:hypothetical protein ElyMa_001669900 [Elysia marginata]|uniref:Uncharacterized protein n=1 Tax=Elysia marginata TaxID=1093978 RepID=A0AAV4JPR7_9GAST|nr:hypothetical protein ElyMa_001669900 [Elysia marginata]